MNMNLKSIFLFLTLFLMTGCETDLKNKEDPHEKFNRQSFQFNMEVDEHLLKPTAEFYEKTTNESVRGALGCFMSNLKEPYYAVNYLVSGNLENTFRAIFRFMVNTVAGGFGIADFAGPMGLDRADTSYKDTLTSLGIETGDYLVLPIFGSSSTRDAIGEVASWFCDPVGYFISPYLMICKAIVGTVHDRAENAEDIDSLMSSSMDLYVMMRSIYRQKYQKSSSSSDSGDDSEDSDSEDGGQD